MKKLYSFTMFIITIVLIIMATSLDNNLACGFALLMSVATASAGVLTIK
jgi:hypothetical protein